MIYRDLGHFIAGWSCVKEEEREGHQKDLDHDDYISIIGKQQQSPLIDKYITR
jgi:hypothetical protein